MEFKMKNDVIMVRDILGMPIRQKHLSCMLNANDLNKAGNAIRIADNQPTKMLAQYFVLNDTQILMRELSALNNVTSRAIKYASNGRSGGTWVCPELFVDIAMWYSPKLKAKVLTWVVDNLLITRDDSGESFKEMVSILTHQFPLEFSDVNMYSKVSRNISAACGVGILVDKWQTASVEQLKLRDDIHKTIINIAEFCDSVSDCVAKSIHKSLRV